MTTSVLRRVLASLFMTIERADEIGDYPTRNGAVYQALAYATLLGYPAGIRIDPQEPRWPVVMIELPGKAQLSWHLPEFDEPWDGHDGPTKYERIHLWLAADGWPLAANRGSH